MADKVAIGWVDPRRWPPSLKAAAGLFMLALLSGIVGQFIYRRFIIAFLIGALVGTGEIVSRYRDAPERALWTMSALLYILINAAASCAALYVIWRFHVAVTADSLRTIITQTLMAGFGAMAFFRTSLFIVRVGNQDVAIGPVAFLQVVLSATDRAVDRVRAEARAVSVTDCMAGVSFDRAWTALPTFCFALMQNVPPEEQKGVGEQVNALKGSSIDNETKVKNLGLLLLNVVGAKVLVTAVEELAQQIQKTVEITIENAPYSMNIGDIVEARAVCRNWKGTPLEGRPVTWSSDDMNVARVSAAGNVTPLTMGSTTLRAVSDDVTAWFPFDVVDPPGISVSECVKGVSFDRALMTLPVYCFGMMQHATAYQQRSIAEQISALRESPLDQNTKAVTLALILMRVFGASLVAAGVKELAPQIQKTAKIELDAPEAMASEEVRNVLAACLDINGNRLPGRQVTWSSDNPNILMVTDAGRITAVTKGTTTLRASADDAMQAAKIDVS